MCSDRNDFIVSLVTDSRRLRKGSIRKEKRRIESSTQTEELELQQCHAPRREEGAQV